MAYALPLSSRRLAVLAAALIAVTPGSVSVARASDESCPERYQAALQSISEGPFQRLKDAKALTTAGNPVLPGYLLFAPQSTKRTPDETAALRVAANLARAKGRADWSASADNRWIADQIRNDLREYLTQGPSPYLCDGVEDYVSILRDYRDRIEGSPRRIDALVAVQEKAARQAVEAALATLRPAPRPSLVDRQAAAAAELRPGVQLGREPFGPTPKGEPAPHGPSIDPDLPPRGPDPERALATESERLAAIDRLVEAGRAAGLVPGESAPDMMTTGALARPPETEPPASTGAVALPERPVIARLAAIRPAFMRGGVRVADRLARRDLVAALSQIEMLDYLATRPRETVDPLLGAIDETLDAILAAHAEAAGQRSASSTR